LWGLLNIGGMFDHRRWAFSSELLRLPITAAAIVFKLPSGAWFSSAQLGLAVLVVALWLWLLCYRRVLDGAPQLPSRVIGSFDAGSEVAGPLTRPAADLSPLGRG
jgi:hypothetical protein